MLATAQAVAETNRPLSPKPRIKMERRDSTTSESSLEHLDLGKTPKKLKITSTPHIAANNNNNTDDIKCKKSLDESVTRTQGSDEGHEYEDDESTDEKRAASSNNANSKGSATTPRPQRHHKRRASRPEKHPLVQLEYNADNPNSLRKKFRFNRSGSDGGTAAITSNESGFVDASSQFLNNSTTHNSASSRSSSPHAADGASSSPECGNGNADREREDMKYVCPICEVVSATPHEFTNHIRCHNYASGDTENFTCRICSKVLSSASSLDRHVLVHTGERPFNCKYCHLTFTTNGNMHRHMRTHKQHQHNHQRRNSNGTKNNHNTNNNNNSQTQQNNNHATTNSTTITTSTTTVPVSTTSVEAQLLPTTTLTAAATLLAQNKTALNGYHMNGDLESCDSDDVDAEKQNKKLRKNSRTNAEDAEDADGCSTDSSTANSHSSSPLNNNNDNNNSIKTYNNNNNNNSHVKSIKRKMSANHYAETGVDNDADADDGDNVIALMRKRRYKTTINNNNIISGKEHKLAAEAEQDLDNNLRHATPTTDKQDNGEHLVCPVCDANDFSNYNNLSEHMDNEHPGIPAKCRLCEVIFRTHRQLNVHPCSGVPDLKIGEFKHEKFPIVMRSQIETNKKNVSCETEALQMKIRSYFMERQQRSRSLSEGSTAASDNVVETIATEAEKSVEAAEKQQNREEYLRQMFLSNKRAASSSSHLAEDQDNNAAEQEVQALSISQQSHDSKDFADIQSILNMTSSSSTSNFLRNFEQSVNTPSSNYSLDKDEEEAQDAFTAEFRKMKLRGEFPCKLCTAVYPNLRALKGHNRVHLSAAGPAGPFRCNMCPYSICDKAALIRHMRSHNGDRPYECAVCNYAFTTKANCERHLRNRHGKTTREEVKRAIIYHPSEDSSCDDPSKKMHMFTSPDFDDELMDLPYTQQPQPKDRSTPVSHLKEMLTAGFSAEATTEKPVKIQVKSLEKLLNKTSMPYVEANVETQLNSHVALEETDAVAPIDLSMDVLDLSKKPTPSSELVAQKTETNNASVPSTAALNVVNVPETPESLSSAPLADDKMEYLLAQQQQLMSEAFPKFVDPTQYLQQLYRQLMFQPLNPFFLQNPLFGNNLSELQKLVPLMSRMFSAPDPNPALNLPNLPMTATLDANKPQTPEYTTPNTNGSPLMQTQHSPLLTDKTGNNNVTNFTVQLPPPKTASAQNQMSRHAHMPPATVLPGGPVKMVIKNGVLMPKQKQRRYRTERPFACEHCSARFTLRSNMERHVKQQHPQYYAQRQRSGHVMRGRGASNGSINNITHLQVAFAQQGASSGNSTISDQVKYAILAQQLKAARRDSTVPELLQQALAHGSGSVLTPNQMMFATNPALNSNSQFGFNQLTNAGLNALHGNVVVEDDEPKLIIDEDENEEDEDEVEEIIEDNDESQAEPEDLQLQEQQNAAEEIEVEEKPDVLNMKTTDVTINESSSCANAAAKKVAETILEQAIKVGQSQSTSNTAKADMCAPPAPGLAIPSCPTASSMKSMIAQAESVGKFLKEVASSPFKDESQDLVSVSKLVDNATNNAVSFTSLFRTSDVANHMEQSDEEGLVASGSASESNNSGTEDVVTPAEPKKKSAYSLAPNRVSCPYCQRMFPWSSSLRRHILTHTGQKPFKCSHCPLLFTTKSNCDRHLLRKHGNVESAVSVYVPTEDVTEPIPVPKSVEEIEQQQRKREEEERRRQREEAATKEREQRELLERQRQQQQKLLLQQEQEQQLLLKQLAANAAGSNSPKPDLNALTPAELPFKCHLCESSFGDRFQCLEHIKNQHVQEFTLLLAKGAVDTEAESNQATADEEERRAAEEGTRNGTNGKYPDYSNRKVICAFCMRRFWSTEDLRRHMRTHSGERPFQCEICLRKFTLKHSMLRHMKKHIGRHYNGNMNNGDLTGAGNSGSDFSDDELGPTATTSAATMSTNTTSLSRSKIQELLYKANEWRNSRLNSTLGEQKENIAEEQNSQPNDLIGNLLGISDQGILNKLLSSPDEAAKLLGVEK